MRLISYADNFEIIKSMIVTKIFLGVIIFSLILVNIYNFVSKIFQDESKLNYFKQFCNKSNLS